MTVNSYLFKKKQDGGFTIYKIPITRNKNWLEDILIKENGLIQNSDVRDYMQIYSSNPQNNIYFSISNDDFSAELTNFIESIILGSSDVPSLSEYKPRSDSKDRFPFDGIFIVKKQGNSFTIGVNQLENRLKVYRQPYLGLRISKDEYTLEQTNNLFLIPKFVSFIIEGTWDGRSVSVTKTCCRSRYAPTILERIFGYREKWKAEANSIKNNQTRLIIEDSIWQDFSKDMRNTRKFVRCFKTGQGSFKNVIAYYKISSLKKHLGFKISKDGTGAIKIKLTTKDQVNTFLDAFRRHIIQIPISKDEFGRADNIEKLPD